MSITYFNYKEIFIRAKGDPAAIVLLTYAQSKEYNAYTSKKLMKHLSINHIPQNLFVNRFMYFGLDSLVYPKYKTIEPQSYIRNTSFLTYGVSARAKAIYIKALSARKINSKENRIPRSYFNKVADNPFLKVDDEYIYFPLEASV